LYYNFSDLQLEFQLNDHILFQHFFSLSKQFLMLSMVCHFRERLVGSDMAHLVWKELTWQLVEHRVTIWEGVI